MRTGFVLAWLCMTLCWTFSSRAGDETWIEPTTRMEFVWIPGGCFQMGSPENESGRDKDEGPGREVCLDGFWMGKYEVSNAQCRKLRPAHSSKDYKGRSLDFDSRPAVYVGWAEARAFAEELSGKGNGVFRLPTEAEWEYAARAGTTTARYWGDSPDLVCSFANGADKSAKKAFPDWDFEMFGCDDGYAVTAETGRFKPNPAGLYDMLGNVWEWCEDVYQPEAYARLGRDNPRMDQPGPKRVIRGGSWFSYPKSVRSADRYGYEASEQSDDLGFRLVRVK